MRSSFEGWTVREAYQEVGTDIVDLVYDGGNDDLPEDGEGEVVSLIDNDGLEVEYDQVWGKQIEARTNPGESALEKFAGLFGRIDPVKRLGKRNTSIENDEDDTELVNSYNSKLGYNEAMISVAASMSLMTGPSEESIFYETFNDGLPEDILFGIGAVFGTGIITGERYHSGKKEELSEEIREREELMN